MKQAAPILACVLMNQLQRDWEPRTQQQSTAALIKSSCTNSQQSP